MQINVHSRPDPPKYCSKPVWFRENPGGFDDDAAWYFIAQVIQSVFDCKLVIDQTGCSRPINRNGHVSPEPDGYSFTAYIDAQDNINHDVDGRLEEYVQEYVHRTYPNLDVGIRSHNDYAVSAPWERYEELWSHYDFFGHGLTADVNPDDLENIRLGISD